jgi:hypothetical protein
MPLPVLAGIPWLVGILAGAFSAILGFFVKYFTKRFAFVLAAVALIAGITSAFFAAVLAFLSLITYVTPDPVVVAVSWVIPSNFPACATAIISAHFLKWVYAWQVKIIQMKLY